MNLCFGTVPNFAIPSSAKRYKKTIYGIFGLISLSQCRSPPQILDFALTRYPLAAEYLIVITGRELQGHLLGHPIYRAVDFDILPISPGLSVAKPSHPVETHLLALVRSHLNGGLFLYSYVFDVTRRLQAQYVARESDERKPIWETVRAAFQTHYLSSQLPPLRQTTGSFGTSRVVPWKSMSVDRCFPQVSAIKVHGHIHLRPQK